MSNEIIIAEWQKNSRETMRVKLDFYQGEAVICARAWYAGNDGIQKPGRGGLTISVRHLPTLASAFAKAVETANAAGLIQGQSE
jgi:hypothetical protein